MQKIYRIGAVLIAVSALASCTTIQPRAEFQTALNSGDCQSLRQTLAEYDSKVEETAQSRKNSWKFILPVAAVGRWAYTHGVYRNTVNRRDEVLAKLREKNCGVTQQGGQTSDLSVPSVHSIQSVQGEK